MKKIDYTNYEQYIGCMEKVKKLNLFPVFNAATINMLAEYFEVPVNQIRNYYNRNRTRLTELGVKKLFGGSFENVGYKRIMDKGRRLYEYNGKMFTIGNSGSIVFPVKAIFFIAMDMRVSHIAQKIQTEVKKLESSENECNTVKDNAYNGIGPNENSEATHECKQDQLQTFNNSEFGSIRTVTIDGEPWFVGKDVAETLGYKESTKAVRDRVDAEDKGVSKIDTPGGKQNITIINESGLYSLILSSKLPSAKKFKRWVTSEVIPSIRKHGAYMTPQALQKALLSPDFLISIAKRLKGEQEKNDRLSQENKRLSLENEALEGSNSTWEHRSIINALMRSYAASCKNGVMAYAYSDLYRELLYNHHIDLKRRKGLSLGSCLSFLKDSELDIAVSVAATICKRNDLDVAYIINSVNTDAISAERSE